MEIFMSEKYIIMYSMTCLNLSVSHTLISLYPDRWNSGASFKSWLAQPWIYTFCYFDWIVSINELFIWIWQVCLKVHLCTMIEHCLVTPIIQGSICLRLGYTLSFFLVINHDFLSYHISIQLDFYLLVIKLDGAQFRRWRHHLLQVHQNWILLPLVIWERLLVTIQMAIIFK
mgnify:CR=1 FL=1